MQKALIIFVAALSLAACASKKEGWTKAGVTPEQQRLEAYGCKKDSGNTMTTFNQGGIIAVSAQNKLYNECMEAHGYTAAAN